MSEDEKQPATAAKILEYVQEMQQVAYYELVREMHDYWTDNDCSNFGVHMQRIFDIALEAYHYDSTIQHVAKAKWALEITKHSEPQPDDFRD
tara:strand:+ start:1512 stop:1787 length:276 start_codon:yes stop_codon:yes gene_type:complete